MAKSKTKKTLFLDTCALLELGELAFNEEFYVAWETLKEIEEIKGNPRKDPDVVFKARKMAKLLKLNIGKYKVARGGSDAQIDSLSLPKGKVDSAIIYAAWSMRNEVVFVTSDIACFNLASNLSEGLEVIFTEDLNFLTKIDTYEGYKVVKADSVKLAQQYQDVTKNVFKLKENEYLLVKQDGKVVDRKVWRNGELSDISYRNIESDELGVVKPRNEHQRLAFDMLQDKNTTIKVLTGQYGTGKDYIMLANALAEIGKGHYDKLVWVRNNVEVKDTKAIGFLPGDSNEKLLPFAMIIADQLGGKEGLFEAIEAGTVELEHLGFIRGRTYNNCIVYCSEAENMTTQQVQLLIGRIGENSVLYMNGDYKQADSSVFVNNNGLIKSVEKLAGNPKFGYVKLEGVERSETARMADLLD